MTLTNAIIPEFLKQRGITQIASLDFETFYSADYTLRKMSTSLYIFDKQFHAHGVGICLTGQIPVYHRTKDIKSALDCIDWSKTALLCHHTQFDALILSHYYNIKPAYHLCSMSMARPKFKNLIGVGLNKLAKELGFMGKTSSILEDTKGKRKLTEDEEIEMETYCLQDITEMDKVYNYLLPTTPEQELDLIDVTVRMYSQPFFRVDIDRISKEIENQTRIKNTAILKTNVIPGYQQAKQDLDEKSFDAFRRMGEIESNITGTAVEEFSKVLRSSNKFAKALENAGAVAPTKISATTGKRTWAFAKTDAEYTALANHPNKQVRDLYEGRMAAKSTTALDKAIKLLAMSEHGAVPVYLNYWAAQTGRWSGGDKIQLQNMPRGGEMRKSIIAPPGHVLTVIDSSGIEMRMLAWLSENETMLDDIRDGIDVYKKMASNIYDTPYDKVDKHQRFIGKIAILGLGYGMSAQKFKVVLEQGIMGPSVIIDAQEADRVVRIFRDINYKVPQLWTRAHSWLQAMMYKTSYDPIEYKGMTFSEGCVKLPTGAMLHYPLLRGDLTHIEGHYTNLNYVTMAGRKYIYGALFIENLVQALSRLLISEQMLEIHKKIPVRLMVHDEVVTAPPIPMQKHCEHFMHKCFTTPSKWCLDLPLDAEYGSAKEYSK